MEKICVDGGGGGSKKYKGAEKQLNQQENNNKINKKKYYQPDHSVPNKAFMSTIHDGAHRSQSPPSASSESALSRLRRIRSLSKYRNPAVRVSHTLERGGGWGWSQRQSLQRSVHAPRRIR